MYRKKDIVHQFKDTVKTTTVMTTRDEYEQYIQESVKRNFYSFRILVLFILVSQIYNISRVLIYSQSGLGTLNNRIYFYFYVSMLVSCLVGVVLERIFRDDVRALCRLYLVTAFVWQLWHIAVNYYDLTRDASSGVDLYLIAVFTCAIFLQSKPVYCLTINVLVYAIFCALTAGILDTWDILNLFIAVMLSFIISTRMYAYLINEIKQGNDIRKVNEELKQERFELHTSLRKHEIIMEYTNDIFFEVDIQQDILQFSQNVQNKLPFPLHVDGAMEWIKEDKYIQRDDVVKYQKIIAMPYEQKHSGEITMRIQENTGQFAYYHLRVFLQYGLQGELLYAIGTLTEEHRINEE